MIITYILYGVLYLCVGFAFAVAAKALEVSGPHSAWVLFWPLFLIQIIAVLALAAIVLFYDWVFGWIMSAMDSLIERAAKRVARPWTSFPHKQVSPRD